MFGQPRWNPFDEIFGFQREVDRLFNQFWSDLPTRSSSAWSPSFHVNTSEDGWRLDIPLPGIDPQHVNLEVAGNTLSIRVEEPDADKRSTVTTYERTLTVPQFLDLEKIGASHRHGMLQLSIPLKDSVKPRRVQIETVNEGPKQLTAA